MPGGQQDAWFRILWLLSSFSPSQPLRPSLALPTDYVQLLPVKHLIRDGLPSAKGADFSANSRDAQQGASFLIFGGAKCPKIQPVISLMTQMEMLQSRQPTRWSLTSGYNVYKESRRKRRLSGKAFFKVLVKKTDGCWYS